jgi:hypothetical protein
MNKNAIAITIANFKTDVKPLFGIASAIMAAQKAPQQMEVRK